MLSTKQLYMKACHDSKELHALTDTERMRLQSHLRAMYLEIEKVCERHNLQMCAGYGTVLGAIRHQGFIPWDDDLDLLMPRDDYDKLINLYADELPSNFKIFSPNSKHGPITRFAKVVDTSTRFLGPGSIDDESYGIFIDIFPLEGTSKNSIYIWFKHKVSCFLMLVGSAVFEYKLSKHDNLYKKLMCSSPQGKKVYKTRLTIGYLFSFLSAEKWFNIIDIYTKCKEIKDGYSVPVGGADIKYFKPVDKDVFFPTRKVLFDDIEIMIPNQPEIFCQMEYGDWTKIPPVEERWQHFIKSIRFEL